ncbi:MAG: DUF86 domain-containing protein [Gammaproteobacteria bacterium]|nr:DUF86 domain-containing protein [Gammaproteobacteria bacterium]
MQPDRRKYLYDTQQACQRVRRFTQDRTLDDYLKDELLRSAVERQFEIIGEALSQLHKVDPVMAGRIHEFRRIVAFRNILIHGYASIHNETVWGVVQNDLPVLARQVDDLLG